MGRRASKKKSALSFLKTQKPWGHEELLFLSGENGYGFKRLVVNPKKMMSYQYHNFKNELFLVEKGTATIRLENELKTLKKGEFIFLPRGTLHQAINKGKAQLKILEFGHPHNDNDIIRVEDPWAKKRALKQR